MANATPFVLSKASQESFLQYYKETILTVNHIKSSQRTKFESIDRAYMRENDKTDRQTQAKLHNKAGDPSALQNITVPIVMPQVEEAVKYQASVFLTGVPIFGIVANAQFMDEAIEMETVLANNSKKGGWTREFMMFFRDGFKYNFAPIEVSWDRNTTAALVTDLNFSIKEGKPVQTVWTGNKVTRLDPYNTFVDPRVPPSEVYKRGEFAGYTEFLGRIELKQLIAEMSDTITMNVAKAFESQSMAIPGTSTGESAEAYYVPSINPEVFLSDQYEGAMNWLSWAGLAGNQANKNAAIQYKNTYEKTTLYCKILPSEFGLRVPGANTPQIWKLIFINHQVIIHAERQTNAHGWIPILIGQPHEDGLNYQTKSLATNAQSFQETTSAFMTSILASRRRAISDRTLYDPSRVTSAQINSANPSAKIPVRPAAYGKNISDAVYPFPYREDQASFGMSSIQALIAMSNQLAGQNPARQGQFVKGNKTRAEFEDIQGNSAGRDQMVSILYEAQIFVPMKAIFKLDILQYQGAESIYSEDKERVVDIDPVKLRNSMLEFKISDGLVPSDKIIGAESWTSALQIIGSSPQIGQNYNIAPLFSYLMKTQGAQINQFEKSPEQVAYEQALGAWQQIATITVEKGGDPKSIPPQPLPEQFGYNPSGEAQPEIEQEASRAGELPADKANPDAS